MPASTAAATSWAAGPRPSRAASSGRVTASPIRRSADCTRSRRRSSPAASIIRGASSAAPRSASTSTAPATTTGSRPSRARAQASVRAAGSRASRACLAASRPGSCQSIHSPRAPSAASRVPRAGSPRLATRAPRASASAMRARSRSTGRRSRRLPWSGERRPEGTRHPARPRASRAERVTRRSAPPRTSISAVSAASPPILPRASAAAPRTFSSASSRRATRAGTASPSPISPRTSTQNFRRSWSGSPSRAARASPAARPDAHQGLRGGVAGPGVVLVAEGVDQPRDHRLAPGVGHQALHRRLAHPPRPVAEGPEAGVEGGGIGIELRLEGLVPDLLVVIGEGPGERLDVHDASPDAERRCSRRARSRGISVSSRRWGSTRASAPWSSRAGRRQA